MKAENSVIRCCTPMALSLIHIFGIVTQTTPYPLRDANQALADLRAGRFEGAAVLVP